MNSLQAVILGCIEGLTEFLPISSTGHMILVSHFLKIPQSATLATFEIVVQVGAILAVIVSYYKKLFNIENIKKLSLAFIPTGVAGLVIFPHIKKLLGNPLLVAVMLVVGGIIILLVEKRYKKEIEEGKVIEMHQVSYKHALFLGIFQVLAMVPGVSRSGAVIVGGLYMRLSRKLLTEFAFLLAVPTMLVATAYTLYKNHKDLSFESISPIAIGTIISFVVAMFVIRIVLKYIRSHSFNIFGYYRIIVGVILFLVLI